MIRKKQPQSGPVVIDLTGPRGNAFYLLGIVRQTFSGEERKQIMAEMTAGDYENLIAVFDKHLGWAYILER